MKGFWLLRSHGGWEGRRMCVGESENGCVGVVAGECVCVCVSVCAGRCENVRVCAGVFQVGSCQESFFEVGECALCMVACELHVNFNDICKPTNAQYYTHTHTHTRTHARKTHTYTHTHTNKPRSGMCGLDLSFYLSFTRHVCCVLLKC